jgi:hypothetical protein
LAISYIYKRRERVCSLRRKRKKLATDKTRERE